MSTVSQDLLARRERARDRHDGALKRQPERSGAWFASELDAVIAEYLAVCRALPPQAMGEEAYRCIAWLAEAHFDRGRGVEPDWLRRAIELYGLAGQRLGPDDVIPRAKLDFNTGNAIRGLSGGKDLALLREADARYRRALDVFRVHSPPLAAVVQQALGPLQTQISLAERLDDAAGGLAQLQAIRAQFEGGDVEGARRAFEEFKRVQPSTEAMSAGVMAIARMLGGNAPDAVAADLSSMGFGPRPEMQAMFAMLVQRYQQDLAAGRIAPERQQLLAHTLEQMRDLMAEQPHDDLRAMAAWSSRFNQLMRVFVQSQPRAETGLVAHLDRLAALVHGDELRRMRPRGESDVTFSLGVDLAKLRKPIEDAGSDEKRLLLLERDQLRPIAARWRQYAMRHHQILATPNRWPQDTPERDANMLAWFGARTLDPVIARLCVRRGLRRFDGRNLDAGHAAWAGVRSAALVVVQLQGERGPAWASPCFVLGLAAATGTPAIVLLDEGQLPPFDLGIPPIAVRSAEEVEGELSERLDMVLYGQRSIDATESTVRATFAQARALFSTGMAATLFDALRPDDFEDPIALASILSQAIGFVGAGAPLVLTPTLPVPYPDPAKRTCFHVTPFHESFDSVRSAASRAVTGAGVAYLHGADSLEPNILRAIWSDLGRSSHVLVDITDQNPNVAFELAVALALGRRVLVIGRTGSERQLFPEITRERVTTYDARQPAVGVEPALRAFLAQRSD